ncbi:hypothetical protein EF905_10290, partial [Streptomyces sp. WAC05374]
MPVNPRSRGRSVLVALAAVQTAAFWFASRAAAAPTPTPSPRPSDNGCELIAGPARDLCESGD